MKLNIVDIASSTMRAVNKTLRNMTEIVLMEMPAVRKVDIVCVKAMALENTFTSIMIFQQKSKEASLKGGMIFYISTYNIKNLFGSLGIDENSGEGDIKDMCGEFCNVAAGCFKTEIVALGYEDVQLSLPENYFGVMNLDLEIEASCKYNLSFSHEGKGLFNIDVFMEKSSTA